MSVCLAITKGLAVTSLGINTGLLTTTAIVSNATPNSILKQLYSTSNPNIAKAVGHALCHVGIASVSLTALSSALFAASFYWSPPKWQHPYLLYAMVAAPLSTAYLYLIEYLYTPSTDDESTEEDQTSVTPDEKSPDLESSLVDLGSSVPTPFKHPPITADSGATCPFANKNNKSKQNNTSPVMEPKDDKSVSFTPHFFIASLISIIGLFQSVVGIYGEGLFI
ncbi:hypothetical protein TBLA_0A08360 [Henningerozyma blattae CBS 6284]|uniref:Autophagy-related protein 33 n=1 Tax=Henningerozyma blattae (strain ATCC 34711 / CBS 6284 / DSM 70876 / NBRC 10599 / NRRL Y-10934 / UCD 77-7) TaxID=1071380 RepID=I2GWX3_HENB6|nr:hypothetical protein TBLA_0A08360 [Tetrapisispora blattae CBS 6284]CCH58625.1 hypothetical protein TBLA_0A08360 [Tetrapisispora blattae CBS 6284]